MSAEFNWWLLIVGLLTGGALTWLVLAASDRRDREIGDEELEAEAAWIARSLGVTLVDAEVAAEVLRAHRRYLGFPPPDALVDPAELAPVESPVPWPFGPPSSPPSPSPSPPGPSPEDPAPGGP